MTSRVESTYYWALCRKMGFPCGSAGKESTCNAGDRGLIPRLGRSSGEGKGYLLHYSGLENSMVFIVHEVAESDMTERLSLHFSGNAFWDFPGAPVVKNLPSNVGVRGAQIQSLVGELRSYMPSGY